MRRRSISRCCAVVASLCVSFCVLPGVLAEEPARPTESESEQSLVVEWDAFSPGGALNERLVSLLEHLDAMGLNDPRSPVHLERPFPADGPAAALDALLRISGEGIRTVIDPIPGRQLARDMDRMLPRVFQEGRYYPIQLSVSWENTGETASGRRQKQTLHLANLGEQSMGSVSVVTIASKLEGSIADLSHGGGMGGQVLHTLRIVPGNLGRLDAGDLKAGEVARLSGDLSTAEFLDDAATHFYYVVLYTDQEGRRRTAMPNPAFFGSDEDPYCAEDRDGPLVRSNQPTCYWDDCESVTGGKAFIGVDEIIAGEDLNGDGDLSDQMLVVRKIGSGVSTNISTNSAWIADGDLVGYTLAEDREGWDINEDGDLSDTFHYWYRASTGEGGGPYPGILGQLRPSDPWLAFTTGEDQVLSDLNGDGDQQDTIMQLVDTRTGAHTNTGIEGTAGFAGRRELWILTGEEQVGDDLNADGDLDDTVVRWAPLPGVSGLPEGVHNTGIASYYSWYVWVDHGDLAMVRTPATDPLDPYDRTDIAALFVSDDGLAVRIVDGYSAAIDRDRWIWSESRQGPAHRVDFDSGFEDSFDLSGYPMELEGDHLVFHNSDQQDLLIGYYNLASGESREIGWTHRSLFGPEVAISGDLISWHNDVRTECYPEWASWMEVHRISTAKTYKTDASGYKYTHGAPGPYYVAFSDDESWSGIEFDGQPGLRGKLWTYYVPPCESFEELETHIQLAATSDPAINRRLLTLAQNARRAWTLGLVKPAGQSTCAFFKQLSIPDEEGIADISRQLVRGCALSTALALGILESEDACGVADNCPGRRNPMQVDLDGDGAGNVCDLCPNLFNPAQLDSDGDGRGDACDLCPLVATGKDEDHDADGVGVECDNCPRQNNPDQIDTDGDGEGDVCDRCPEDPLNDDDWDWVCHSVDNCPSVYNPGQEDADGDGVGDACDSVG